MKMSSTLLSYAKIATIPPNMMSDGRGSGAFRHIDDVGDNAPAALDDFDDVVPGSGGISPIDTATASAAA